MSRCFFCTDAFSLTAVFGAIAGLCSAAQPVDFAHDVVPILQAHCVECHGGQEAEGSFSVNSRGLMVESGHVVPGDAGRSELLERLTWVDSEFRMPPENQPPVSAEAVAVLRRWIEEDLSWEPGFSFAAQAWEPPLRPRRPELPPAMAGRHNPVDRILDAYQSEHHLVPPAPIDDATFLRRASLDLVGLLPEPMVLQRFLQDSDPNKRAKLVQALLSDNIAWADHWLTFFNDLLRNDYSGTGFITGGRFQISGWL